jgi:hypothetical protein
VSVFCWKNCNSFRVCCRCHHGRAVRVIQYLRRRRLLRTFQYRFRSFTIKILFDIS